MNRMFAAGLLALPVLLTAGPDVRAGGGYPCSYLGCGGFCFKFLGQITQDGPLFNYGPYCGYYPFEPYGPWNSQLQYTGPYPSSGACGANGCGVCGKCGGRHARGAACGGGRVGCGSDGWGRYSLATFKNVFHRVHPFGHKAAGCSDCGAVQPAGAEVEAPDVSTAGAYRRER